MVIFTPPSSCYTTFRVFTLPSAGIALGDHYGAVVGRGWPGVAGMVRTIYQQLSPEEVHAQADRVVAQLREHFPRPPRYWRTPYPISWPSPPSLCPIGRSSGPTIHWSV